MAHLNKSADLVSEAAPVVQLANCCTSIGWKQSVTGASTALKAQLSSNAFWSEIDLLSTASSDSSRLNATGVGPGVGVGLVVSLLVSLFEGRWLPTQSD